MSRLIICKVAVLGAGVMGRRSPPIAPTLTPVILFDLLAKGKAWLTASSWALPVKKLRPAPTAAGRDRAVRRVRQPWQRLCAWANAILSSRRSPRRWKWKLDLYARSCRRT